MPRKQPFIVDIEAETLRNTYYRNVVYTVPGIMQIVYMSIAAHSDIPMEKHHNAVQFLRIEQGDGIATVAGKRYRIRDGFCVTVPPNTLHRIQNTGTIPMKLYTIYSPPQHPDKLRQRTRAIALAAEEN